MLAPLSRSGWEAAWELTVGTRLPASSQSFSLRWKGNASRGLPAAELLAFQRTPRPSPTDAFPPRILGKKGSLPSASRRSNPRRPRRLARTLPEENARPPSPPPQARCKHPAKANQAPRPTPGAPAPLPLQPGCSVSEAAGQAQPGTAPRGAATPPGALPPRAKFNPLPARRALPLPGPPSGTEGSPPGPVARESATQPLPGGREGGKALRPRSCQGRQPAGGAGWSPFPGRPYQVQPQPDEARRPPALAHRHREAGEERRGEARRGRPLRPPFPAAHPSDQNLPACKTGGGGDQKDAEADGKCSVVQPRRDSPRHAF